MIHGPPPFEQSTSMEKSSTSINHDIEPILVYRNLEFRLRAASDFFFRLTLGFSYCSLFRTSDNTPVMRTCLLKRRKALSRDSFLPTLISAILLSLPPQRHIHYYNGSHPL